MNEIKEMANYLGLSGLIFACPFGKTSGSCPFNCIHNMQLENRFAYVESLSDYQILGLLKKHKKCLSYRENGWKLNQKSYSSNTYPYIPSYQ